MKAVEFANDISVHATSYDVKMEYHKLAVKIVEFVKKECVHKKTITETVPETDSVESKPAFKPQEKSSDDIKITFADVAGLYDVKKQIRFKVLSPMQRPKLAEKI